MYVGGEEFRAKFLLLLLLESFVPECLYHSTTHSMESSGLIYLQMDTAFYQLSSRLLHWI